MDELGGFTGLRPLCYGLNCVPGKACGRSNPGTSGCGVIWKQGCYRSKVTRTPHVGAGVHAWPPGPPISTLVQPDLDRMPTQPPEITCLVRVKASSFCRSFIQGDF